MREAALAALAAEGVIYIPGPLVSPGGVIEVSFEKAGRQELLEKVSKIAAQIVERSVKVLFERARRKGSIDAVTMYHAFETMVGKTRGPNLRWRLALVRGGCPSGCGFSSPASGVTLGASPDLPGIFSPSFGM